MHAPGPSLQSRRRFIRLSLGGTLALAVGGGTLRWFTGGYASRLSEGDVPIALSVKEFAVVKALVQALLPAEGPFPSGESLRVHQRIDEEVWAASPRLRDDLKNALQVLEHAPFMAGYYSRFSSLAPADRADCFDQFVRGRNDTLQRIALGLKEMVHLFYYVRPETWAAIRYEGPLVPQPVPPASQLAYGELLRRQGGKS